MLQRLMILLGTAFLLLVSCEQEDNDYGGITAVTTDEIPVDFSFSMKSNIEYATDYTPIRAAADTDENGNIIKARISNVYKVLIAKKIDTRWIIEKMMDVKINPDDNFGTSKHDITDSTVFNFSTELRPGEYRMTIFTGLKFVTWNALLKEGMAIGTVGTDDSAPLAYTYQYVGQGYLNTGHQYLQEEIFTANTEFTVTKTEDLHSSPLTQPVSLKLKRMVTRLRILLKYVASPNNKYEFFKGYSNSIVADLTTTTDVPFPNGLNVWGDPFYEENNSITNMKFGVFTWNTPQQATNGFSYMLGMKEDTRQYSPYYFSDPEKDITVSVTNVEVAASSFIGINYLYSDIVPDIVLKHNQTTGFVLAPGDDSWSDTREGSNGGNLRNMILDIDSSTDKPVNAADIFDLYYELKKTN